MFNLTSCGLFRLFLVCLLSTIATDVHAYDCSGCLQPTFNSSSIYTPPAGGQLSQPVVADFNNDGKMDVALMEVYQYPVVPYPTGNTVVLLGNGSGGFSAPIIQSSPPSYGWFPVLASGDFNNDHKSDLVSYIGDDAQTVFIAYGDGTGHFGTFAPGGESGSSGGNTVNAIAVADLDNDGNSDVVVTCYGYNPHSWVWFGSGNGLEPIPFNLDSGITNGTATADIEIADLNGDGYKDVLLTDDYSQLIWRNDGARGFYLQEGDISGVSTVVSSNPSAYAVGDFNSDGFPDFATAYTGDLLTTQLSDGGGLFARDKFIIDPNHRLHVWNDLDPADINGDGKLDLLWSTYGGEQFSTAFPLAFMLGDGTGAFSIPQDLPTNASFFTTSDFTGDGKPDIAVTGMDGLVLLTNTTYQTPVGTNVTTTVANTNFQFDNVTSGGTTTVSAIDPATAGDVPGGFALANVAFEVSTTATFTGEVTSCFSVTSVNIESDFLALRVLHNEGGTLIDRTSSHDFANRKICATTTSFSPFYLATVGKKVESLFDRSKAFKSGSTVPVKVKIKNSADQNISAATLALSVRGLRRIGAATASVVNDAGNSNPDYVFRYDSNLGGYIYNLKTTGLSAGKYVLSFYAGNDTAFLYTVTFDVR